GYALRTYERYARILKTAEGRWRVSNPAFAHQYLLNLGTIVESPMLNIRIVKRGEGGRIARRHLLEEIFLDLAEGGAAAAD
ncbi:hypothetical protein, partial [Rhizobium johnstonii]|uniref:hypothetical protein n=1 Tax=Rhizobium johnstonii TaxID=3019933 RepID=UPI003F9B233B